MDKVVFDIDDILWPLNKRIANLYNIDHNALVTYSIFDNPILNDIQKDCVLKAYSNPELFKDINWFPGADMIMDLEKCGVKVFLNSNCFHKEIAKLKYEQIHKLIDIPDSQFILNVYGEDVIEGHKDKNIGDGVFAFVDDSPHNLIKANAQYLYTLNRPWNINCPNLEAITILRFDNLMDIITDIKCRLSYGSMA